MDISNYIYLPLFFNTKKNKLISTYYTNALYLFIYESINYFTNIPNLITLTIGIIQSYNSYHLIRLELPIFILYIILILLLIYTINKPNIINNFIFSSIYCNVLLLSNTNYIVFSIYRGNFINIIISMLCYILHISIELHKFYIFHNEDKKNNKLPIKTIKDKKLVIKKAEDIEKKDILLLDFNTLVPCDILVDKIMCQSIKNIDFSELSDYNIGTFYNKENTGENISKKFMEGDIILTHKLITRPNISIYGKIHKLIQNENTKSITI